MSQLSRLFATSLCLIPLGALQAESPGADSSAAKPDSKEQYLRVVRDENDDPVLLETAVRRFVPSNGQAGPTVDLISCIHIGDRAYYQELNRLFANYDVVLYEMVKPEGTVVAKDNDGSRNKLLALVQRVLPSMLGLELQTDVIDYNKDNMVHADLSSEQLRKAMQQGDEDETAFFNRVLSEVIQRLQTESDDTPGPRSREIDAMALLDGSTGPVQLRQMIADKLDEMGIDVIMGPTLDRLLIRDRNEVALAALDNQIADGAKKVAIFYGAAHMPSMQQQLVRDFKLRESKTEWITAWDINQKPKHGSLEGLLRALTNETNNG